MASMDWSSCQEAIREIPETRSLSGDRVSNATQNQVLCLVRDDAPVEDLHYTTGIGRSLRVMGDHDHCLAGSIQFL